MRLDPIPDAVTLTNIQGREFIFFVLIPDKNVNASFVEFTSVLDGWPLVARKCDAQPRPVHAVDYPHTVGVTVRNKYPYREGIGHSKD